MHQVRTVQLLHMKQHMRTPSMTANFAHFHISVMPHGICNTCQKRGFDFQEHNSPNSWATWRPTCKPTTGHRHTWHFREISGSYLAATHNACITNVMIHAAHVRKSLQLCSSCHRYLPHVQSGTFQPAAKCCQWVAHNRRLFQLTVSTHLM